MKHRAAYGLLFMAIGAICLLTSCASFRQSRANHGPTSDGISQDSGAMRSTIVTQARTMLGQKPDARFTLQGRSFTLDCIGTVSAAFWGAGYDIQRDFGKYAGNGVSRLFASCQAWGSLKKLKTARPGDIVFWENTYDRNGDGIRYNDGITHAGIVVAVDDDGTVQYLHESVTRGVALAWFNLQHPDVAFSPDGKLWNSPMYLGASFNKKNNPPRWLSGDLWTGFGDANDTILALKSGQR